LPCEFLFFAFELLWHIIENSGHPQQKAQFEGEEEISERAIKSEKIVKVPQKLRADFWE